MEFWIAEDNTLFAIAIGLMLLIAILEGALTAIGFGFSHILDNLLPDFDVDVDMDHQGGLSQLLGWINIGKVPALILFIAFLTSFGLTGYLIQGIIYNLTSHTVPSWLLAAPALFMALPIVRFSSKILGNMVIKDESEAISSKDFVGGIAVITVGIAKVGSAAEARYKDTFGTTHYLMVVPDNVEDEFKQGESVLIVSQQGSIFTVIAPRNDNLL